MSRKNILKTFVFVLIINILIFGNVSSINAKKQETLNVDVSTSILGEAKDFATAKFRDPWDMSEFTDVSQYLNGAGRHPSLTNIQIKDGVFSATSIGDNTSQIASFYPLHSGYEGFIQVGGNLGSLQAIDSQEYQCFYIAMKVKSPEYIPEGPQPDVFRVLWSKDYSHMVIGGGLDRLYPETAEWPFDISVVHNWRLYKIDLTNPPHQIQDSVSWTESSEWTGLQINPTIYKDIEFSVDWIRLTSCKDQPEYQVEVSWTPSESIDTIWVRPDGTARDIQIVTGIDGTAGSYIMDTKGLASGIYKIGLGTLNEVTHWSPTEVKINRTPLVDFARPSPLFGEDYFTQNGNPWDADPTDIKNIECSEWYFTDGKLNLDTKYPAALPEECKGPELGEADSQMFLNMPAPLENAGQYRYLSFRMYINGDYAIPADGMIGRWIWKDGIDCTYVSADIPYEVGWHTYIIDLYDPFNGTPVSASPGHDTPPAGCTIKPWSQFTRVTMLRLDPNENWTGNLVPEMDFHQEFDWIRLTTEEIIPIGDFYPIQVNINKPVDELEIIEYYYTTDTNSPMEYSVKSTKPQSPPIIQTQSSDSKTIFLPIVWNGSYTFEVTSDVEHKWDTSNISPGEYYVCVSAYDGFSGSSSCTDSTINMYSP